MTGRVLYAILIAILVGTIAYCSKASEYQIKLLESRILDHQLRLFNIESDVFGLNVRVFGSDGAWSYSDCEKCDGTGKAPVESIIDPDFGELETIPEECEYCYGRGIVLTLTKQE